MQEESNLSNEGVLMDALIRAVDARQILGLPADPYGLEPVDVVRQRCIELGIGATCTHRSNAMHMAAV